MLLMLFFRIFWGTVDEAANFPIRMNVNVVEYAERYL